MKFDRLVKNILAGGVIACFYLGFGTVIIAAEPEAPASVLPDNEEVIPAAVIDLDLPPAVPEDLVELDDTVKEETPAPAVKIADEKDIVKSEEVKTDTGEAKADKAKGEAEMQIVDDVANKAKPNPLGLREAVLSALDRNVAFSIDRISPMITRTGEAQERAAFDPTISGDITYSRNKDESDGHGTLTDETTRDSTTDGGVSIQEFLPTGTTVELGASRSNANAEIANGDSSTLTNSYDVTVTQSLLRGFGTGVNLASLKQAKLDTRISRYELRGAAEALIAEVESAYWDCILAEKSIAIYEKSLEIAQQQIDEVKARIDIGNMAETELIASEAELASRREDLIDARGEYAKNRLYLVKLINPESDNIWKYEMKLTAEPVQEKENKLDSVENHVVLGLRQRADLNQARLSLKQGELEVVRTRNGLLPKLDMFVHLGGSRYANAFTASSDKDGRKSALSAGLAMEYVLGNRAQKASHEHAQLSLEQAQASLDNMKQIVQVDIRTAYIEVERSNEQVKATTATRKLREESLRTEREKFRVGQSTSILVAQAWRDLVESQIAEISSVIAQRKAMLNLYLQEGTLLERRGILTKNQ
ncbi:MAG: TolC family protein [Planctomycetes bacterium]|nr:TolC family protein [Planctomycetota bacterium]